MNDDDLKQVMCECRMEGAEISNNLVMYVENLWKLKKKNNEILLLSTEGRQHQGMDRPGVQQVQEGSDEQGKMEKTGCEIICGTPTTLAIKG